MIRHLAAPADPLDLEIDPGVPVRSLKSPRDCTAALMRLENDMAIIRSQIANAEENPEDVRPGWRTRAQSAMRWKKLTAKAIKAHALTLASPSRPPIDERRKVLLAVIYDEIGEAEFERIKGIAAARHPGLFDSVEVEP